MQQAIHSLLHSQQICENLCCIVLCCCEHLFCVVLRCVALIKDTFKFKSSNFTSLNFAFAVRDKFNDIKYNQ